MYVEHLPIVSTFMNTVDYEHLPPKMGFNEHPVKRTPWGCKGKGGVMYVSLSGGKGDFLYEGN